MFVMKECFSASDVIKISNQQLHLWQQESPKQMKELGRNSSRWWTS
jgi:hypothetical protein